MIWVQRSTVRQGECRSHSAKLSWLDAWEYRQVVRWSGTQASSNCAQGVVQDTVDEASVSTATPDWRAVLRC